MSPIRSQSKTNGMQPRSAATYSTSLTLATAQATNSGPPSAGLDLENCSGSSYGSGRELSP